MLTEQHSTNHASENIGQDNLINFSPEKQLSLFPELRYMGSKKRLLGWIKEVLSNLDFESAIDPFSGSGSVSYLMKSMDRRVVASDFLNLSKTINKSIIENDSIQVDNSALNKIMKRSSDHDDFIEKNFTNIFYTQEDLKFLDRVSFNIRKLDNPYQQALATSALIRSCAKRQPRGVFTISGDLSKYDDGRRDLKLSLEQHFFEQIKVFNDAIFSNGKRNLAIQQDVFESSTDGVDLVYLDPPYVPRSDDNCYIKRYHFLEGLSCYWQGLEIDYSTKVRKIPKRYTPFSYRRTAIEAFERLFKHFKHQKIVLSYSSNGYPDLDILVNLMKQTKNHVEVHNRSHTYHFGTHSKVKRASVEEYLIVGSQ